MEIKRLSREGKQTDGVLRWFDHIDRTSIRAVFGKWLAIAFVVAFAVASIINYVRVTSAELANAEAGIRAEFDYLNYQISRSDDASVGEFLHGIPPDNVGSIVLESDGIIVASNDERFVAGQPLDTILDKKTITGILTSLTTGKLQTASYQSAQDATKTEAAYVLAEQTDAGIIFAIRPERVALDERAIAMGTSSLTSGLLLIAIYITVRVLLGKVIARRIDKTNAALARITAGDLDTRVEVEGSREFQSLSAGINDTVDALQGWIAEAEARMESELAAAKAIQESTLPREFPPFPEIGRFDIYASMNAAREVGGDFYDFFLVKGSDENAGKLAFVVADVSGKGVPAALFMMEAKAQIRGHLAFGLDPGRAIELANDRLCEDNDAGMFVTAWIGVLDYETGSVEYVNAGHNPPLAWHGGSWSWLTERSGLPLGLFNGMPYEAHTLDCEHGDKIVLYSDGVTEAMSTEEELYGEERLEALLRGLPDSSPRDIVDAVRTDVAAHAAGAVQSDDITILALEVRTE